MSIWFWVFAILSTFSFSLQWALTAKYARDGDSLSVWTYRGLSLIIIMLPLLLFTDIESIFQVVNYKQYLVPAWFLAAISVWMRYGSNRFLPVGLSNVFVSISSILTALVFWFLVFQESLSIYVVLLIWLTTCWWIIVSLTKVKFEHLDNEYFFKWIALALISWILWTSSVMLMIKVSRELNPFVAWYFWEVSIWLASLFILIIRNRLSENSFEKVSMSRFVKIFFASSPTLIGTWSLALAGIYGPVGIVSAVSVLWIVFSTILGIALFQEKLKPLQYFGILIIMIGILWIKLV